MSKENMQQEYDINPKYYYDVQSKLHFYHDFSCHIPFEDQFDSVQNKYIRRIECLYKCLSDASLFVRYIEDENELDYVCRRIDFINDFFRSFDSNNAIIFFVNEDIAKSNQISNQFIIVPNRGSKTIHHFLSSIPSAEEFFIKSLNPFHCQRLSALARYKKKKLLKRISRFMIRFEARKPIYKHYNLYQNRIQAR